MTRAVAQDGAELIEGIHWSIFGEAITIKQANGIVREVPWHTGDNAAPILLDAMILSLETEDQELNRATKEYCLNCLKKWNECIDDPEEDDGLSIDYFYSLAEAFMAGYKAAFTKIQPYWKNPLTIA